MKSSGGRPVSVAKGISRTAFPMFSPDGTRIAFAGQDRVDSWDCDAHVFTAPVDGSGPPEMVAPGLDRGVLVFPGLPAPFQWLGNSEIAVLLADHGGVALHVANLSTSVTRRVIGGDRQIDGFSALRSRSLLAFTSSWPDRPSELWLGSLKGDEPRQFTRLNDELLETVDLAPVTRGVITRPDGTDVEYFALIPAQGARRGEKPTARRLPLHLDIHGGPHGMWPSGRFLGLHQSLAGAGYVVLLPNPRGSTGYGQGFTEACTGDWGGEDCEDILACCDDLVDKGIVDEGRMFLSGGSYGGFMTSWIVGHSRRFRAAAAMAAVIDQASLMLTTEIPDFCRFNFGGTPWEQADEFTKRSPLTYLPDVSTPVLVVHWEGDLRVPIAQGEELYAGLRLLGKEAEFVRYPGGFHIYRTPSQAVDWMHQIIDWDARHDSRSRARRPRTSSTP